MAFTLSDLLQDVYTELGQLRVGTASGGSASTLADAELARQHAEDEWRGGAIFMAQGAEPPAGEFARVASFAAASGTFTFAAALSEAVEAGMRYGLASAYYPLETMIELVNSALRGLGDIPLVDEDSLVTGGESVYAATAEWTRRRPLRIDYLAVPGVSAGNPWKTIFDWDFVPAQPGASGLILFNEALPSGRPLRVWYQAAHPRLGAHSDEIAAAIAPDLAVAAGVERALRWQRARQASDDHLAALWEVAQEELNAAKRSFPIWKPRRAARLLAVRG
jgi:hypothetical protein